MIILWIVLAIVYLMVAQTIGWVCVGRANRPHGFNWRVWLGPGAYLDWSHRQDEADEKISFKKESS